MTARPILRFTTRYLLAVVLAACVGLAWIARVRHTGFQQVQSVEILNNSGCWIPPGQQLNTIASPTQPGKYIQTRNHNPDPGKFAWEWLFGRGAFLEHSDVVIDGNCELSMEELASHLRNLRCLEYVFYAPIVIDENEAEQLQTLLPDAKVLSAYKLTNK